MKHLIFLFAIVSLGASVSFENAFGSNGIDVTAFRMVGEVAPLSLKVPTVTEVPIPERFARKDFAVLSDKENIFVPYLYQEKNIAGAPFSTLASSPENGDASRLIDGSEETFAEYPLVNDGESDSAELRLSGNKPVTAGAFSVLLGQHVALPKTVQVSVVSGGSEKIVLANRSMESETVRFPETTANTWIIRFTFSQPLRINEIVF